MLALMIVWNHLLCTCYWSLTAFNNSPKTTCTVFCQSRMFFVNLHYMNSQGASVILLQMWGSTRVNLGKYLCKCGTILLQIWDSTVLDDS